MFGANRRRMSARERLVTAGRGTVDLAKRIGRDVLATALGLAIAFGVHGAWTKLRESDHFRLRTLEITGQDALPAGEIAAACGLAVGVTDLLLLSADEVRDRCEADPRVRRATVEVEPPSRVAVRVEEQATAMYAAMDDGLWAVNPYGEAFAPADLSDLRPLPLLVGTQFAADPDAPRDESLLRDALALVRTVALPGSPWEGEALELEYDPDLGFGVSATGRGLKARFGRAPFPRKLERLERALSVAADRSLVVDEALLDNEARPNAVTLRLVLSGPVAGVARAGSKGVHP